MKVKLEGHCPQASNKGTLRRGGTASHHAHWTVDGDGWSAANTDRFNSGQNDRGT